MSEPTERRARARFITVLPLSILGPKGEPLDTTATAHDLTAEGFKGECQLELREGQVFDFSLELPDGPARGKAAAVWVKKTDFSTWVGARVKEMPWSDRRRLKSLIAPSTVDWGLILDTAFKALVWITVLMALHRVVFERPLWLRTLKELVPTALALGVMGWALLGLTRRR